MKLLNLFKREKIKENSGSYKNIVIVLLLILGTYFVVSMSNSRSSYRDEISRLEGEIETLEYKLSSSISKDSITYYLTQQEGYNQIIESLNTDIANLKKRYDEKKIIDVDTLSIDDNIKLLSRFLSKETID